MADTAIRILLVEDSPSDAEWAREVFDESLGGKMIVAGDGEQALAMLQTCEPPDLVLLDLALPRKSGLDVLSDIRADASLRNLPVIVLATSAEERDLLATRHLDADEYLTKPLNGVQLRLAFYRAIKRSKK